LTNIRIARGFVYLLTIGLVTGLTACNPEQTGSDAVSDDGLSPDTVVARVGDEIITIEYLESAIRSTPRPEQFEYVSSSLVRELVDLLIDQKLMAAAARAIGLDASEKLVDDLATAGGSTFQQERLLAQAYIDFSLEDAGAVSDEAIESYYSTHVEEFTVPERIRLTRVVLPSEVAAAHIRDLLRQGLTAEAIVAQSDGSVQAKVLWLQRRGEPGPMEEQAFALQTGEISDVFPVAAGFALIRVEERVDGYIRPLAEVRAGITAFLAQNRQSEMLDAMRAQLRHGAEISIEAKVLDAYVWEDKRFVAILIRS
jgi:parvulin-like peptidyl-prolyl isomerase